MTHRKSTATPSDRVVVPRALRAPSSGSPGDAGTSQSHSGGTVHDTAGKVDDTTGSLPVKLPDPNQVIQGVTGQLPQVQAPSVQLPPVGLP